MNDSHNNKTKHDIDPNATSGEDYGKNAGKKKTAVPDKTKKKISVEER
jgi:hypothetical protein